MLVSAIFILVKDSISEEDLRTADSMLRSFVKGIKPLYGEKCYTYNTHNLLHLPLLVRRWGPLWATSTFPFESVNGFLKDHLHGTKHLGQELINNIKISQSVAILEKIVNAHAGGHDFSSKISQVEGKPLPNDLLTSDEERNINSFPNMGCYCCDTRPITQPYNGHCLVDRNYFSHSPDLYQNTGH